jgi:hypothetical protein
MGSIGWKIVVQVRPRQKCQILSEKITKAKRSAAWFK